MHFYGLKYREALDLPIFTFWMLNAHVGRIRAEQDLRAISVMGVQMLSDEDRSSFRERLVVDMGTVVKSAHAASSGSPFHLSEHFL